MWRWLLVTSSEEVGPISGQMTFLMEQLVPILKLGTNKCIFIKTERSITGHILPFCYGTRIEEMTGVKYMSL